MTSKRLDQVLTWAAFAAAVAAVAAYLFTGKDFLGPLALLAGGMMTGSMLQRERLLREREKDFLPPEEGNDDGEKVGAGGGPAGPAPGVRPGGQGPADGGADRGGEPLQGGGDRAGEARGCGRECVGAAPAGEEPLIEVWSVSPHPYDRQFDAMVSDDRDDLVDALLDNLEEMLDCRYTQKDLEEGVTLTIKAGVMRECDYAAICQRRGEGDRCRS